MLKYIPITFLLFIPQLSEAQIMNIEKYRIDKDTFNVFMGHIGLGFSSKKQHISTLEYEGAFNLAYLSKKHSFMTINDTKFQKTTSSNIISEGYTHFRINFFRHNLISYEPFVQFQYDIGRGLYNRNLLGLSFRLNLIENDPEHQKKIEIAISSGAMYEYEKWKGEIERFKQTNDTSFAETNFLKSTSNIFAKISLHQNVTLYSIIYYQARFNDFLRPRFVSDIQLVFNINKHFSFANKFTSTIDAAPIVKNNNFIYALSSNLIIKIN